MTRLEQIDEALAKLREHRLRVTRFDRPHVWAWVMFGIGCVSVLLIVILLYDQMVTTGHTVRTWSGGPVVVSSAGGSYCTLTTTAGIRPITIPRFHEVPQYVRVDPGPASTARLDCNYPVSVNRGAMALLYRAYGNDLTGLTVTVALIVLGGHLGPVNAYRMRQRRLGRFRTKPGTFEQKLMKERKKLLER